MAKVLIIDDDRLICEALARKLKEMGHAAECAQTLKSGLGAAVSGAYDVVFLDVMMPDGDGLQSIPAIREAYTAPEIIIMTGVGDHAGAEMAIKSGAWDYIEKPASLSALTLSLTRALKYRAIRLAQAPECFRRDGLIGESTEMRRCLEQAARAAASDVNVLIVGETGTGKELIARTIHANSRRSEHAFVAVDCAALTENLAQSALFGCEKGAFTGADRAREGLIKLADGGTLFLDEVGELPLSIQKSLLRVLQERRFRPLGTSREVKSDFRLIGATHQDIDGMVSEGSFRQDLLYRLKAFPIAVPSLRDRREDIALIALHVIEHACADTGLAPKACDPDLLSDLARYNWPGNVRELVNALERACAEGGSDPVIFTRHLPDHVRIGIAHAALNKGRPGRMIREASSGVPSLQEARDAAVLEVERDYLARLITIAGGELSKAMSLAGLSRSRFYELLKKHGLSVDG